MLVSISPPAPMAVRRPGASSPLAGGTEYSASTMLFAGLALVQPAGVVNVSFSLPMVNEPPGAALSWAATGATTLAADSAKTSRRGKRMADDPWGGKENQT